MPLGFCFSLGCDRRHIRHRDRLGLPRHRRRELLFQQRQQGLEERLCLDGHRGRDQVDRVQKIIFIGDGLSDVCALEVADIVFAKNRLAEHCEKNNINFIPYRTLNDVVLTMPEILSTDRDEIVQQVK